LRFAEVVMVRARQVVAGSGAGLRNCSTERLSGVASEAVAMRGGVVAAG
jgi:hypothetical protein